MSAERPCRTNHGLPPAGRPFVVCAASRAAGTVILAAREWRGNGRKAI